MQLLIYIYTGYREATTGPLSTPFGKEVLTKTRLDSQSDLLAGRVSILLSDMLTQVYYIASIAYW